MTIPRKINFLQLGRYGTRSEQCYRQTFERSVDWMEFNLWMSAFNFRYGSRRMGIAIDPSYISKSGSHTPHVGTFWSGCAGAVKHGLEILGIGIIDVDLHECMMLRAVQTTLEKGAEKDEMTLYQWYAKVLGDYKAQLQRVSRYIVADAAFSKKTFVGLVLPVGFHLVSRLRSDAVLYYLWDGEPTGRPGRPRVKGDKIDFKNLDKSKMRKLDIEPEDGEAYALKAHCKSLGRVVSLVIHIMPKGGHKLYFSTDENMSGEDVIEYYRTRFQIEFNFYDKYIVMQSKVRSMLDSQRLVRLLLTSTSHNNSQCPRSLSQSRRSLLFSQALSESRLGTRSAYAFSNASRLAFESALA